MVTGVVPAKESPMIKLAFGNSKRISEIRVMACILIIRTLYWFCGVFIYGATASSHCGFYFGFNASLGNASMLSNVGLDRPPTVYTTSLVIVRGIIYCIESLSTICQ